MSLGCQSPAGTRTLKQTLAHNPRPPRTPTSGPQGTRKSCSLASSFPAVPNSWGRAISLLT